MVRKPSLKHLAAVEKLPDARTDRTSVFLAQIPSSRAVTSALRIDKGSKHQTRIEQLESDIPGSQEELGNKENDFDLQVRIDRSILVDTRAQENGKNFKGHDTCWDQV